jgi:primosomal protein N' (replication factor Y)
MDQRRYISVILPLKLEWEPCYWMEIPDLVGNVGQRVRVKFAGKEYVGVVSGVDIVPDIAPEKIQPVLKVETSMENVLVEEIELWRRVAEYYLCSVGEVYKAAYPANKINMEEARAEARAKAIQRREKLAANICRRLQTLQERIQKKQLQLEKSQRTAKQRQLTTKTIIKLEEDIRRISEEIESTEISLKAAQKNVEAAKEGLNLNTTELPKCKIELTEAQQRAYNRITDGFKERKPVMLHGVTGSGKTEIYIKAAHETLSKGKNVLYLVPEIALSRQLEDRLYEHFEDRLLIFHSGETAAAKRNIAEIIRSQKGKNGNYILLGTRSSLFLPHHDLGLIIVDEEHDSSYKQDSPAPRYNGRDTALMLHLLQKCNILLGSATPSLEELYNCISGRHVKIDLTERFHGADDAEIEIIDTKAERRKRGMIGNFSRILIEHIRNALAAGRQVLILRGRRAWATAMQCESCGEIQKCPHCNVSMSFHKTTGQQKCHYCGKSIAHTGNCSKCGGILIPLGAGTQKIEEEAAQLFPEARIARLDSDTAQNKTFEKHTVKAFANGDIDILIGTQIVTKGFDFENLGLVAVIAADSLLGVQDFRADEKALQLLEQFRGRCGRRYG